MYLRSVYILCREQRFSIDQTEVCQFFFNHTRQFWLTWWPDDWKTSETLYQPIANTTITSLSQVFPRVSLKLNSAGVISWLHARPPVHHVFQLLICLGQGASGHGRMNILMLQHITSLSLPFLFTFRAQCPAVAELKSERTFVKKFFNPCVIFRLVFPDNRSLQMLYCDCWIMFVNVALSIHLNCAGYLIKSQGVEVYW